MPPPPHRVRPPDSSTDETDGALKTRDENAKEFSRFISCVNVVTCNPCGTYGRKGLLSFGFQGVMVLRLRLRANMMKPLSI